MNKNKTYNDSKELPFWNYKRIIQTGDFFYVVKGYESGDDIDFDIKEAENIFNKILENYALSTNAKSEDVLLHGMYLSASNEINKLSIIYNILILKQSCDVVGAELSTEDINSVLDTIKIQRSDDIEIQKEILSKRIDKLKNDISKLKNQLENKQSESNNEEIDIDEQFLSICHGLEMPLPDETKISLYQYGVLIKMLVKKIESFNKQNRK